MMKILGYSFLFHQLFSHLEIVILVFIASCWQVEIEFRGCGNNFVKKNWGEAVPISVLAGVKVVYSGLAAITGWELMVS